MKAAIALYRLSWLWRHRKCFAFAGPTARARLLVDVSVIIGHDAQTGIQRVVRAIWSELLKRNGDGFDLVPVYASPWHGYCYAPLDFLDRPNASLTGEPAAAGRVDHFLGLDLATHSLPKYRRQLRAWRTANAEVHFVIYDLLPLFRPDWFNTKAVAHFRRWFQLVAIHSDQALCISQQVARDLRDRLRFQREPRHPAISCLAMGGDIAASRPSSGVCNDVSSS